MVSLGPRGYYGNCLIILDDKREVLARLFERVDYVGRSADNPYALEKQIPVFICKGVEVRHARRSLAEVEALALKVVTLPE